MITQQKRSKTAVKCAKRKTPRKPYRKVSELHGSQKAEGSLSETNIIPILDRIILAFVDIGFGTSAIQQSMSAANDNCKIREIASDFIKASSKLACK